MSNSGQTSDSNYTTEYVKSDFDSVSFLGNPHIDNLFTALQSLAAEVWANRRRQYIVEALFELGKPVSAQAIDAFVPSDEQRATWKVERDQVCNRVFSPFLRTLNVTYSGPGAPKFDPRTAPATDTHPRVNIKLNSTAF